MAVRRRSPKAENDLSEREPKDTVGLLSCGLGRPVGAAHFSTTNAAHRRSSRSVFPSKSLSANQGLVRVGVEASSEYVGTFVMTSASPRRKAL